MNSTLKQPTIGYKNTKFVKNFIFQLILKLFVFLSTNLKTTKQNLEAKEKE